MSALSEVTEPLWRPDAGRIAGSNLAAFAERLCPGEGLGHGLKKLHAFSVERTADFWAAVWDVCDVVASEPWAQVVDDPRKLPGAAWFPGARLNFAENLLRFRDDQEALVFWNEEGRRRALTYAELYAQVARCARALKGLGVGPGDRVAGFLPNLPETVVAMLAATSLGALWSSCSPDFGVRGVLDRFGQISPKVLFVADGYRWAGKAIDTLERSRELVAALRDQQHADLVQAVVVPYGDRVSTADLARLPGAVSYEELLAGGSEGAGSEEIEFAQLPFDHPLYIMYSSGTTGLPKCMVHGAGGTLLQHLKELVLHTDLRRDDRIFYYTTCGWMMWNWLVSSLAVGATVLLYDGSPFHAETTSLFDLAEAERMTVFGTSAKYLALAEKEGLRPRETHDLSTLRAVLSTGSPLAPEGFAWVYSQVKEDLCLSSISGGTDLISCFALGNPVGPVYPGELQTLGLGMAVEVWNEDGAPLPAGEKGELVCTRAFPSMPVGFWNDADDHRYGEAYFDHFPGVWRHGDWVELRDHPEQVGMVVHGRSDTTLNPGGVRIGTAEIYRQVEALEEVVEALVVGQQWQDDVRIVLFVRLREGLTLDPAGAERIRRHIRAEATPRHVPAKVLQVADIPRTRSGKISELAVRNILHGRPVKNTDALANPEALELYRDLPELAV